MRMHDEPFTGGSVTVRSEFFTAKPTPCSRFSSIEVFHTRDQNHMTAGAAPFWGSRFATAAVAAVYML